MSGLSTDDKISNLWKKSRGVIDNNKPIPFQRLEQKPKIYNVNNEDIFNQTVPNEIPGNSVNLQTEYDYPDSIVISENSVYALDAKFSFKGISPGQVPAETPVSQISNEIGNGYQGYKLTDAVDPLTNNSYDYLTFYYRIPLVPNTLSNTTSPGSGIYTTYFLPTDPNDPNPSNLPFSAIRNTIAFNFGGQQHYFQQFYVSDGPPSYSNMTAIQQNTAPEYLIFENQSGYCLIYGELDNAFNWILKSDKTLHVSLIRYEGTTGVGGGISSGDDISFNNVDICGNLTVQNTNMIQTFESSKKVLTDNEYYIADISNTAVTTGYFTIQINNTERNSYGVDPIVPPPTPPIIPINPPPDYTIDPEQPIDIGDGLNPVPDPENLFPYPPTDYNQTIHFLAGFIDEDKAFIKVLSNIKKNPNTGIKNIKIKRNSNTNEYYLCFSFYNDPQLYAYTSGTTNTGNTGNDIGDINNPIDVNDPIDIIDPINPINPIDPGDTVAPIDDNNDNNDPIDPIFNPNPIGGGSNLIGGGSNLIGGGSNLIGGGFTFRNTTVNSEYYQAEIDYIKVTLVNNHNNYNSSPPEGFGLLNWELTDDFKILPSYVDTEVTNVDLSLNSGNPYGISSQPEYFMNNIIFHPENGKIKAGEDGEGVIDICGGVFVNKNVQVRGDVDISGNLRVDGDLFGTANTKFVDYMHFNNIHFRTRAGFSPLAFPFDEWNTIAILDGAGLINNVCMFQIIDRSDGCDVNMTFLISINEGSENICSCNILQYNSSNSYGSNINPPHNGALIRGIRVVRYQPGNSSTQKYFLQLDRVAYATSSTTRLEVRLFLNTHSNQNQGDKVVPWVLSSELLPATGTQIIILNLDLTQKSSTNCRSNAYTNCYTIFEEGASMKKDLNMNVNNINDIDNLKGNNKYIDFNNSDNLKIYSDKNINLTADTLDIVAGTSTFTFEQGKLNCNSNSIDNVLSLNGVSSNNLTIESDNNLFLKSTSENITIQTATKNKSIIFNTEVSNPKLGQNNYDPMIYENETLKLSGNTLDVRYIKATSDIYISNPLIEIDCNGGKYEIKPTEFDFKQKNIKDADTVYSDKLYANSNQLIIGEFINKNSKWIRFDNKIAISPDTMANITNEYASVGQLFLLSTVWNSYSGELVYRSINRPVSGNSSTFDMNTFVASTMDVTLFINKTIALNRNKTNINTNTGYYIVCDGSPNFYQWGRFLWSPGIISESMYKSWVYREPWFSLPANEFVKVISFKLDTFGTSTYNLGKWVVLSYFYNQSSSGSLAHKIQASLFFGNIALMQGNSYNPWEGSRKDEVAILLADKVFNISAGSQIPKHTDIELDTTFSGSNIPIDYNKVISCKNVSNSSSANLGVFIAVRMLDGNGNQVTLNSNLSSFARNFRVAIYSPTTGTSHSISTIDWAPMQIQLSLQRYMPASEHI